jgi:hypothetical protein
LFNDLFGAKANLRNMAKIFAIPIIQKLWQRFSVSSSFKQTMQSISVVKRMRLHELLSELATS